MLQKSFFDDVKSMGGVPIMWKAGHSLIKQKMKETGLAGWRDERTYLFADKFFGFDDAIYSSLRLLENMGKGDRPLSAFLLIYQKFTQLLRYALIVR